MKAFLIFMINFPFAISLKICGETDVTRRSICTLDKNYDVTHSGQLPMQLISSVTLFSISEFDLFRF